jgi:hypothetical protein
VEQPGLTPDTISFKPDLPVEYNIGFKNPNAGLPFERRASFSKDTIAAKVYEWTEKTIEREETELTGALQLVPATDMTDPRTTTWKFSA